MISRQMKNPNRIVTPQPEIACFSAQSVTVTGRRALILHGFDGQRPFLHSSSPWRTAQFSCPLTWPW